VVVLAAGLTLGMLSLDALELQLKARAGTPEEKAYSKKVRTRTRIRLLDV
jgi:hypothetical protein